MESKDEGLVSWFLGGGRAVSTEYSRNIFFRRTARENAIPGETAEVRPATFFKMPASKTLRGDDRKTLRNMPFTLETFRLVSKRMSLHS